MKKYRLIQLLTGIHYIHDMQYGFGYKFPIIRLAYFKSHGFKKVIHGGYHNCTKTGVYRITN